MRHKILWALQMILLLPLLPVLGAIKVKSPDISGQKWNTNASGASTEYAANAEAAANEWASETARAADTFQQAISSGNIKQRFLRGVQKAGAGKYARKIRDVAAGRFSSGVSAAQQDYVTEVTPYLQTIAGLTLSQRRPRGDPANYRRVEEVGKALNARRLAALGSST